ncbi:molybdate ABC transporter substrate-binding protein [Lonepinella koalarum]|uniref:Molybdate transport system substrate-binding protein n=2 Tax=Lonepinella koalarum TaxID=53417 RepID=A0A4R1L0B8_9PAST|nr:molybdate transport system substrate-binding protein [Lonepinella koalarum]
MKLTMKKLALVVGVGLIMSQGAMAKVTVFAAASMTNALQQVADEYKKVKPNEEVVFSFASSSVLAKQIEQGAPADIFVSADLKWMDYLSEKDAIIKDSRAILVGNSLVMIAPKDSKIDNVDLTNDQWQKSLDGSFLAVGDPEHVPAGIYAKTALTHLGQWTAVESKLARANNVRAALALVEQAESPLGVVYGTDAAASQKVKVVATFPADSHPPVEYPVALIKDHGSVDAKAFLDYLKSDDAKKVLVSYGFTAK